MMLNGSLILIIFAFFIKVQGFPTDEIYEDLYQDCGSNQNSTQCFGLPKDCFYTKNCSLWVKFSQENGDVNFNLYGNNLDMNSYISVGLSEGNPMKNGSVVFCHAGGVGMSWNVLGNGYDHGDSLVLPNTTGITNAQTNLDETGTLSCSFKRQKVTKILTPNAGDEQVFDLGVKEKYILALAKGPILNYVSHVVPGVHGMSHKEDIGHTHYRIDFNPGSETSTVEPSSTAKTVEPTTASATRTSTGMATMMLVFMMNIN